MALHDPSTGFPNSTPSPTASQFPPQQQNKRTHPNTNQNPKPVPILPSMSTLLHPDLKYDQQNHDRSGYQLPPNYLQHLQNPLRHNEQNPEAPPSHFYQPPQNYHNQPIPYLISHNVSLIDPVSQQDPVAQRRQVKKISQRREDYSPMNNASQKLLRPLHKESRRHQDQEITRYQNQNSPSFRPEPISRRESIPISGLLSSDIKYVPLAMAGQSTDVESSVQPLRPTYAIKLVQQPMAARACGFGERDRRVIDPPPILKMEIDSPASSREELKAMIRSNLSVVHCTLWDPATNKDDTAMPGTTDKRQQRRLMGTLVSSPFVGLDEHNIEGCFFTFPDLSVRTPGIYSLKFSLVVLDPSNMRPGGSAAVQSTAMSEPFQVYNAKDFCGMRASTALTKKLKNQGCLISVKKGNPKSGNAADNDRDDQEHDSEDDGGESNSRGKKRSKR